MLNDFACNCPVYVACGFVDLRKGIDISSGHCFCSAGERRIG